METKTYLKSEIDIFDYIISFTKIHPLESVAPDANEKNCMEDH